MARSAGLVPVRVEPKARGDVPEGCRGQPTPKALARPAGLEPAAPGLEGPSSGTIGHKNGYQQLRKTARQARIWADFSAHRDFFATAEITDPVLPRRDQYCHVDARPRLPDIRRPTRALNAGASVFPCEAIKTRFRTRHRRESDSVARPSACLMIDARHVMLVTWPHTEMYHLP
jgi:hypothetical protein